MGYIHKTFDGYKPINDIPEILTSDKVPAYMLEFLNNSDLGLFFNHEFVQNYNIENAGWSDKRNAKLFVENLIKVIDINGKMFKAVTDHIKKEMKDFDADSKFYVIGGEK